MAQTRGTQSTKIDAGTVVAPGFVDGTLRVFAETVTYAAQASGDTIVVGRLPKGAVPVVGILATDTSTGTATIAIGTSGDAAKYKGATAHATVDVPVLFGKTAALNVALTAEEEIIATVGTAALPASGTLTVTLVYAFN